MSDKKTKAEETGGIKELLPTLICCICAVLAALCFRRSAGIISMLPIAFILAAICAFLKKPDIKLKAALFGITVFTVNTVEQKDIKITLLYTTLCLLAVIGFGVSAKQIKKHKKAALCGVLVTSILCLSLSFVFIGNPIKAFKMNGKLNTYIAEKYPEGSNIGGHGFERTRIYYDPNAKAYATDMVNKKYPTEGGSISTNGGYIDDGIGRRMAAKAAEPYVLEITGILREKFPDKNFSVEFESYSLKDGESIYSMEKDELKKRISYRIFIHGIQVGADWKKEIKDFMTVLGSADADYSHIVFNGGASYWVKLEAVIPKQTVTPFMNYETYLAVPGTSRSFNRYIDLIIFK